MPTAGRGRSSNRFSHPSVQALLAAHPEESDPKRIIRRLAREKVAYAKALGWSGPPFNPRILTSIFGIRCKPVGHEILSEGRLIRYPDGKPWIEFRNDSLLGRQHFTILHEFAHTFFPDFSDCLPLNDVPVDIRAAPEKQFENLCDIAAAEMLMPAEDFSADIARGIRLSCEMLLKLATKYEASIDAVIHRTIELTDHISCGAIFLTDQRGEYRSSGPLWTKYCCRSPMFKGFIQPGVVPPRTSVAVRCLEGSDQTTEAVKETWWLNGSPRTWLVQAVKLPRIKENREYSKVAVLVLPSGY